MEKRLAEFRAARQASAAPPPLPPASPPPPPPPAKPTRADATAGKEQAPPPPEECSQSPKAQAVTTPLPWWTRSFFMNVTFLKFLLWLVLLGLFVELEFGLAYFVLSMFYWIYVGTRGPGERQSGEKSAYSVFNPGCEAIEGTLTAEQLERELQYQPFLWR
ncbi:SAYSvFN domain-containing protein 1 [Anolis sagrei]|uniref:SAYSvFN domain-containing protein 1 n=1 Tax=Anolis sagrei TaxID=38937 RepID=UPI0035221B0C